MNQRLSKKPRSAGKRGHAGSVTLWAMLVLMFAVGPASWAHAILEASTPLEGAVVAGPSLKAILSFNSRIDQSRSRLTLDGPGQTGTAIPVQKDTAQPAKLVAQLSALKAGPYTLHWQVLAADGHITRGAISFRVK